MQSTKFRCHCCDEEHDISDLSFGADAPSAWNELSENERMKSELGDDFCTIRIPEGDNYFVRGCIDMPVIGLAKDFVWGAWCSVSGTSMDLIRKHWNDPDRAQLDPMFGWFYTQIPTYPETLMLKALVHLRDIPTRPYIDIEPTLHPFSVDCHEGIEFENLKQKIEKILHPPIAG